MKVALIGYTGFVGRNLERQLCFDGKYKYNSKNITDIQGKSFDIIYCSGVSAVKWLANMDPDSDLINIVSLLLSLERVKTNRFVLLSTIDEYRKPINVSETTPISTEGHHAYGTHRRLVENFVQERFSNYHIIRLPGLFGDGLKKNVIFDLLNNNQIEKIHSDSIFQFYNLNSLSHDIQIVINTGLSIVNFATEPVSVKEIASHAFGVEFDNRPHANPSHYDMQTNHARFFGVEGRYLYRRKNVLDGIKVYADSYKRKNVL